MSDIVFLWFTDWQTFTEQLILILGFLVTIWGIWQNTESNKTRLLHEMNNEERDLEINLFNITKQIKSENSENQKELKMQRDFLVTQYLNFLEHLALLINERKISGRLAKKLYRNIMLTVCAEYKERIFPNYRQMIKLHRRWDKS